jgi:hypothetical protein
LVGPEKYAGIPTMRLDMLTNEIYMSSNGMLGNMSHLLKQEEEEEEEKREAEE